MICSFSLSKNVNLTVFYCKMISQLFTMYSTETLLKVLHCSIFTVFYR